MDDETSSPDLAELPPLERDLVLYLSRAGAADLAELSDAVGQEPADVREALARLVANGQVILTPDGRARTTFSRTRRRTPPARLWSPLPSPGRLYSQQEIAALRTAIPMLQFARARLSQFADHGPGHALRVKEFATQLSYVARLSPAERRLLRLAAVFHDIGNAVDRRTHNHVSQEAVERLTAQGQLPFRPREAELVALLCRWHRDEYDPERCDRLDGETIRTGLAAAVLRVADAMDIDYRRSGLSTRFRGVLEFFYPQELAYWTSLERIHAIRVHLGSTVTLQVLVDDEEGIENNLQVAMLREEIASTPLGWSLQVIPLRETGAADARPSSGSALVVYPFEPHSLVMAALSQKHLAAVGETVEHMCYPDTANGTAWLWNEALAQMDPVQWTRLVIIGDRPDATKAAAFSNVLSRWQTAGASVTLLNRHEVNWARVASLSPMSQALFGGDWAYFWGDGISQADLRWGRIAALCTRDPTQSTVGLSVEEERIARGLVRAVYAACQEPPLDTTGWVALAEPLIARVIADDRAFFVDQSGGWPALPLPRTEGRALVFEIEPEMVAYAYWAMEAEIELRGRGPEREHHFNVPYAIATWPSDDGTELLAINHWREEQAIPIRLLFPIDVDWEPEGDESAVRVRLPRDQAETILRVLVAACAGAS